MPKFRDHNRRRFRRRPKHQKQRHKHERHPSNRYAPKKSFDAVNMRGITKRFGNTVANDGIQLNVHSGEIHALLGENGAGKTTLMNILCGAIPKDAGEIRIHGQPVEIRSERDAIALKIGMVHQHFMLIARLTVAENVVLGTDLSDHFWFDDREAIRRTVQLAKRFGFDIDPIARVWDLPVGVRQRVEILKALHRGAEILILDEPTSVLTPQETEHLFDTLRTFRRKGKAVVFITHKLKEVMDISDRVSVLRNGKLVATVQTAETNPDKLAQMMVGRDTTALFCEIDHVSASPGKVMLQIQELRVQGARGELAVKGVNLECRSGEIVGVAGVEGNGQMELVQALRGLRQVVGGKFIVNGKDLTNKTPREINECGCCHITEDRQLRGLMLSDSVQRNLVLGLHRHRPFARGRLLNRREIRRHARKLVHNYDIRTPGIETPVRHLSGGNQQKVILARELSKNPDLVIAVQPTRGLDIAATCFVREKLIEVRNQGKAVLLFCCDLDEVMAISDRIAVMFDGCIMGVYPASELSRQDIGLMMMGKSL